MSTAATFSSCACPNCDCTVQADQSYERNGKAYCSQACADLHPAGQPCPSQACHCGHGTQTKDRTVSDAQPDPAIEESVPASDPLSP